MGQSLRNLLKPLIEKWNFEDMKKVRGNRVFINIFIIIKKFL